MVLIMSQHLLDYPVIHDGVETFKGNPYGQKSLQLSDSAYKTFAAPVIPYLQKPYQYVSPYVKKADDLGDKALSKVDERIPVVKKPTGELYSEATDLVLFPYHKGIAGKDHLLSVYSSEYKKAGGENGHNLVVYGKAAVGTAIVVTAEALQVLTGFLGQKKAQAQSAVEKANN
jgi:hypothetical protein